MTLAIWSYRTIRFLSPASCYCQECGTNSGAAKHANTNSGSSSASQPAGVHALPLSPPQGDQWLAHLEAADYLGVAKSTLYRFVCEERIETRKIGGRLEYRLATLDKFKDQQVRPARRSRTRGIITPTLGSGK